MLKSKKGYVYILTNDLYKGDLLKIGMTTRSPEIRASELFEKHSGVPGRFKVVYKKQVEDCEFAEALIHKNLSEYRANDYREFFKIPISQAKAVIDGVCNDISKIHLRQYDKSTILSRFEENSKSRQSIRIGQVYKPPLPPVTVSYKTEKSYFCKVCNTSFGVGSNHFNYTKLICKECSTTANDGSLHADPKKEGTIVFKNTIKSLENGDVSTEDFKKLVENNFQEFSSFTHTLGYNLQKSDNQDQWILCSDSGVKKHIYSLCLASITLSGPRQLSWPVFSPACPTCFGPQCVKSRGIGGWPPYKIRQNSFLF